MRITSSAFSEGSGIPAQFTCEGADRSPPLTWSGVPAGTRALALIVDDPDAPDPEAPTTPWVHWVVYDIPGTATGLGEGALPDGARVGTNDWQRPDWGGPCPPIGRHRYFFRLYALDAPLGDLAQPTKLALLQAVQGHVLAEAKLMGTYQKRR